MPDLSQHLRPYRVIIITGASSGIGRVFATRLMKVNSSARFFNLSRSKPEGFSSDIILEHRTTDLSSISDTKEALKWLKERLLDTSEGELILINNSGFGSYGRFPAPGADEQVEMIGVNVVAPVYLTAELLPELRRRGGAVINIASTAAFQPTPYMSVYGATKSFVLNWSLALQQELKWERVHVLAVCPGPTESNFFKRAGFSAPPLGKSHGQTAEDVVEEALQALARRRPLVVTGWKNKILAALSGPLPKTIQAWTSEFVLRKMRLEKHQKENL